VWREKQKKTHSDKQKRKVLQHCRDCSRCLERQYVHTSRATSFSDQCMCTRLMTTTSAAFSDGFQQQQQQAPAFARSGICFGCQVYWKNTAHCPF